jgi:hypothetical protein
MTKNVKHSGAGGGNGGGGLNEDDFNDMYGTKYLGPDDVKKPTATMTDSVDKEIFDRPDGRSEAKVLLHFKAFRKPLPCNKTNALNLASAYGKNPTDWVGKPVLVKTEPTSFGGKPTKGVRVYPADPNDMKGDRIPFDR